MREVAFLGRSNVGKSSLLNALVHEKGLAFTSATPGRTQTINFYSVNDGAAGAGWMLVDLPGYGYARAPKEFTARWKALIEAYLLQRSALVLSVIVLDARRGWMEMDLQLKDWLAVQRKPSLVVSTKIDKLKNQKEKHQGMAAIRKHLDGLEWVPFSAVTGQGVREIWQAIWKTRT